MIINKVPYIKSRLCRATHLQRFFSMDQQHPPQQQQARDQKQSPGLVSLPSEGAPETKDLLEAAGMAATPEGGAAVDRSAACIPDWHVGHDDKLPTVKPPGYSEDTD